MSLADFVEPWLAAHRDDLVAWRRHIHAHPELGRQEFATTQFVASHLAEAGLNPKVLPGGTGLICDLGPEHGPRVALRADMDALPMAERTGASYASVVPNVTHACGHDAHTAILLGTALALASVPELPVGLRLIFQAAEELMPGGAIDAIAAGALVGVSRIFALHCDPRLAVGKVAVRPGPITSAADQIDITLQSHGGHTSRPHLTGDLVYGLGTLITGVPGVLSRRIDPRNSTVMVWGAVNAGVAANAIPQTGTLLGTIRTASHDTWQTLESIVRETVSALLAPLGIEHSLLYRRGVPPVVNEEISTRILTHAIEGVGPDVLSDTRQSGGGEDFSWYLEEVPGAMARLGVWSGRGPQRDLHQPTFDLDERSLAVGVRVLVNTVEQPPPSNPLPLTHFPERRHQPIPRARVFVARRAVFRLHFAHARAEVAVHSSSSIHRLVPTTTAAGGWALTIGVMNAELEHLLDMQNGVATSAQILACLNRWAFEKELRIGSLHRMWQGIYCRGEPTDALRLRGLDLSCGTAVAVCLGTAAAMYGFDTEEPADLHVLNPPGCQLRSADGLVVHRRDWCAAERGRRQAGHGSGVDGGRGRPQSAASARIGDAGCRVAQRHLQRRRIVAGGGSTGGAQGHRRRA